MYLIRIGKNALNGVERSGEDKRCGTSSHNFSKASKAPSIRVSSVLSSPSMIAVNSEGHEDMPCLATIADIMVPLVRLSVSCWSLRFLSTMCLRYSWMYTGRRSNWRRMTFLRRSPAVCLISVVSAWDVGSAKMRTR